MRTLMLHSDYLRYKTRSKTKLAEDIEDEKRAGEVDNALITFAAIEKAAHSGRHRWAERPRWRLRRQANGLPHFTT